MIPWVYKRVSADQRPAKQEQASYPAHIEIWAKCQCYIRKAAAALIVWFMFIEFYICPEYTYLRPSYPMA